MPGNHDINKCEPSIGLKISYLINPLYVYKQEHVS